MARNEDIVWQAFEYTHKEKDSDWYWALGLITFAGMASAYMFGNTLFTVLIFLIGFTSALFGARKPNIVSFGINRVGIRADKVLYPFQTLDSFWVFEKEDETLLLLKSRKFFSSQIVMPLGEMDPDVVRDYLLERLPEEEDHEPMAQRVMDYLGF